jgi:MFS superfamily sulfate permease-like transporter
MKFDKFGLIAVLTGIIVLVGMQMLYYHSWMALLAGLVTGGIAVFGITMLIVGLLIMFI